jgi:hypothetical protein
MEDRACGQARSGVVRGNATVMGEMPERTGTGAHARQAGGLERGVVKHTCNLSLSEILSVVLTFHDMQPHLLTL